MTAARPRHALLVALASVGLALGLGLVVLLSVLAPLSQPQTGAIACNPSGEARSAIPPRYLSLYQRAAHRYRLDWAVLAAIGQVESGHGSNMGPSSAGALGPMQFMPATWAAYAVDGDHDGRRDVMSPADAIPAAARYLRAAGAPGDWHAALLAYNHATWYVQLVLDQAARYRASCREHAADLGGGTLAWPVRGTVTSPFGMRWGRLHAGIDIAAPAGTAIHAAERGSVTLLGPVAGYGNYLCIQHRPSLTSCYAHLSDYRTQLGRRVARGQLVGLVGCTGHCLGDHLHFEVRVGPPWSRPVDPLRYLASAA